MQFHQTVVQQEMGVFPIATARIFPLVRENSVVFGSLRTIWDQRVQAGVSHGGMFRGVPRLLGEESSSEWELDRKGRNDSFELNYKNLEASNFTSPSPERKGSLVLNQHINTFRSLILNPVNNFICTASVEKACDTNHQKQLTDCHKWFSSEESSLLNLNTSLTCNSTRGMVEGDFSTNAFYSN